jgi:hypothetical protein
LDEIFDGLDKKGQKAVKELLESLTDKVKKVFVISHTDVAQGIRAQGSIHFAMRWSPSGSPLGTTFFIKEDH